MATNSISQKLSETNEEEGRPIPLGNTEHNITFNEAVSPDSSNYETASAMNSTKKESNTQSKGSAVGTNEAGKFDSVSIGENDINRVRNSSHDIKTNGEGLGSTVTDGVASGEGRGKNNANDSKKSKVSDEPDGNFVAKFLNVFLVSIYLEFHIFGARHCTSMK